MVMAHHHPAGVAGQALGRFRGNVSTPFEDRLPRLLRIRQHLGIDMDHHLVALAWSAGIEAVMQRCLREQGQRIGLLLGDRDRFRGDLVGSCIEGCPLPAPLIQALPGRKQGLLEQRSHLGLESSSDDHHAVLGLIHMQGSA
jgi:hypothetical protein